MPSHASRFVVAAVLGLLTAAGPAHAVWEAPQRLDQTSEGFGNSADGDVAEGDNGLATILFFQADDEGTKLYATRRAADVASWTSVAVVGPHPSGSFAIEAAPDGSTAGAYRRNTQDPGSPLPGDETTTRNVFGLGWPAAATAPNTADLPEDQGSDELPAVDADGRGNGWVAFIDGDLNLQIVRFDLNDPSTNPQTFTVEPVSLDPPGNQNLNETESRSNPRIDVNADGDVAVSFVEARRIAEPDGPPTAAVDAVYVVRRLQGATSFSESQRISHESESDPVNEHDVAIVDNGDMTVLFAADPDRDTTNRLFARRWLATGSAPRPESSIEFVSSSAPTAPTVSQPRAEAGPVPRVTAAWMQGTSELNAAERSGSWTFPQTLSSSAAAFDVAVDTDGVATAVFRQSGAVMARRRAPDQQWAAADTISSAPVSADVAPKVDAGRPLQADAYLVQNDGATRKGAFATRFSGLPPVEPPAPVRPETGDCPNDIAVLFGDDGDNSIAGSDERETILGGEGDDTLSGNGGDDCIRGEGGNDTVNGDAGNDNVGGGDGDDRVSGGEGNDRLDGGAGVDTVNGDAGDDVGDGGDGDDKVRGGAGDDLLGGGEGDDTVSGNAGTNILLGGIGNDRVLGGPERDRMFGEDGDDRLVAGDGPDEVNGGTGNDKLRGGNGRNVLDGADGDDGLRGGSRRDRLFGSDGLDTMFGLAGNDSLVGGRDEDKAYGGSGRDRLFGGGAADRLRGGSGADRLSGAAGKDRLFGDSGKDRLRGGAGGDRLNGGGARDRISGGRGNDRIRAVDGKRDVIRCGAGRDRVAADGVDRVSRSCEKVSRAV